MVKDFVQIIGKNFTVNGKPLILRGWALGSWMNYEHFMMGMPGTHSMIQEAFSEVYGETNADQFFTDLAENFISEADIAFLKTLGINSIRIPFGYRHFFDDDDPDLFLEKGFSMLERVISLCRKYEMYVILDLHSVPGSQNTDWHSDNITGQALFWKYRCFQDQVVRFWKELANRYKNDPWIAGYDVLNEPGYGLSKDELNGFYDRLVEAIREVDKNHIIFLEGDDFGRSFELFDVPSDPQLTYVIHFYPFVLDADVLDPAFSREKRIEIFKEIFYRQIGNMERFERPIWCGESGYEFMDDDSLEFYSELLGHNIDLCESNGISWNLWTYKDARRMGITVPRSDSPWMEMRREIEKNWSHDWEQKVSMEIIRNMGKQYYGDKMDDFLAYDLDFRIRSIMHRLGVETILKPVLRGIPWEKMKDYPQSFLFGNCDIRDVIVQDVKEFIQAREEGRNNLIMGK